MLILSKDLKHSMKSNPAWIVFDSETVGTNSKSISYNKKNKIKVVVNREIIYSGKNRKFAVKLYNKQ